MPESDGNLNRSTTAELELISRKRAALQRLVKITSTLNRLHQGLQSVILMGRSVTDIPRQVIEKFNSLRARLDNQPTDKLQNTLSSTEQRIQSDIKRVLEIAQKTNDELSKQLGNEGDKLLATIDENFHEYVDDFRRKGQTSVALRITLKARNAIVRAFSLPVPTSLIETQISVLDRREAECRSRITTDIDSLQQDIRALIERDDCDHELRGQLLLMAGNLNQNKAHITAGKPMEDMPILYESIELAAPPHAVEDIEEISKPDEVVVLETPRPAKIRRGFFERLWDWLNSSTRVKWKDIKKYK